MQIMIMNELFWAQTIYTNPEMKETDNDDDYVETAHIIHQIT